MQTVNKYEDCRKSIINAFDYGRLSTKVIKTRTFEEPIRSKTQYRNKRSKDKTSNFNKSKNKKPKNKVENYNISKII